MMKCGHLRSFLFSSLLFIATIPNVSHTEGTTPSEYQDTTTNDLHPTSGDPRTNVCEEPPDFSCAIATEVWNNDSFPHKRVATYSCPDPYINVGVNDLTCGQETNFIWEKTDSDMEWPNCQFDCGLEPNEPMADVTMMWYDVKTGRPKATYQCGTVSGWDGHGFYSSEYYSYINLTEKTVTCDSVDLTWNVPQMHCVAPQRVNTTKVESQHHDQHNVHYSYLTDKQVNTCLDLSQTIDTGPHQITLSFLMDIEVYELVLYGNGSVGTGAVFTVSIVYGENNKTLWTREETGDFVWNKARFLWNSEGSPHVAQELIISWPFHQNWPMLLSVCEVQIIGRPRQEASCTRPPVATRGQMFSQIVTGDCGQYREQCSVGTVVSYVCEDNWYKTEGESNITCLSTGLWSKLTLTCIDTPELVYEESSVEGESCVTLNDSTRYMTRQLESGPAEFHLITVEAHIDYLEEPDGVVRVTAEAYPDEVTEVILCQKKSIPSGPATTMSLRCVYRPVVSRFALKVFAGQPFIVTLCNLRVFGAGSFNRSVDVLDCVQEKQNDYKGQMSYTYQGYHCDFWKDYFDANDETKFAGETVAAAQNFCRKIEGSGAIACFVNGTLHPCPVLDCDTTCVTPWSVNGDNFRGALNYVLHVSQYCNTWEPVVNNCSNGIRNYMFPVASIWHNRCRNPDRRSGGPWCEVTTCDNNSTTDNSGTTCTTQQAPCGVPDCPTITTLAVEKVNLADNEDRQKFYQTLYSECWVMKDESDHVRHSESAAWPKEIENSAMEACSTSERDGVPVQCHDSRRWYRFIILCDFLNTTITTATSAATTFSSVTPSPLVELDTTSAEEITAISDVTTDLSSTSLKTLSTWSPSENVTTSTAMTTPGNVTSTGPTTLLYDQDRETTESFTTGTKEKNTYDPTQQPDETNGSSYGHLIKGTTHSSDIDKSRETTIVALISSGETTNKFSTLPRTTIPGPTYNSSYPPSQKSDHSKQCPCPCSFRGMMGKFYNKTGQRIGDIIQSLMVDKSSLSKTRRAKTSAPDDRTLSKATFSILAGVLFSCLLYITVLSDTMSVVAFIVKKSCPSDKRRSKVSLHN